MKLVTRHSPIAMHFGSLDTRLLQLNGGPGGWSVRAAEVLEGAGGSRHNAAVEALAPRLKDLKLRGKDCLISVTSDEVAVSLVPVDPHSRSRLSQTLKETAMRSIQDPEGVIYRYMPLSNTDDDPADATREELLLLALGQSEMRRCITAIETLRMRPVSLEVSAFPLARTMAATQPNMEDPWGFLHLGFGHSIFGIVQNGQLRFLKPMQLNGERLLNTLEKALNRFNAPDPSALSELLLASDAPQEETRVVNSKALQTVTENAVGHATEIVHALRMEAEALAQEVRACLRHFANRHRGAKLAHVQIAGMGAKLPEVETALGNALSLPTQIAEPFTALGITAPQHVLEEQHLWCIPLGLAMRGYA
ncbi:MAG: pilus assembly protein PilM [Planctomycetota bacterium]|nr:pilus assembly protein PilM [Planctomycetota bacterium]MDA1113487.1 pilus assembly protein PilM [Planctomycetota bacterium]